MAEVGSAAHGPREEARRNYWVTRSFAVGGAGFEPATCGQEDFDVFFVRRRSRTMPRTSPRRHHGRARLARRVGRDRTTNEGRPKQSPRRPCAEREVDRAGIEPAT